MVPKPCRHSAPQAPFRAFGPRTFVHEGFVHGFSQSPQREFTLVQGRRWILKAGKPHSDRNDPMNQTHGTWVLYWSYIASYSNVFLKWARKPHWSPVNQARRNWPGLMFFFCMKKRDRKPLPSLMFFSVFSFLSGFMARPTSHGTSQARPFGFGTAIHIARLPLKPREVPRGTANKSFMPGKQRTEG